MRESDVRAADMSSQWMVAELLERLERDEARDLISRREIPAEDEIQVVEYRLSEKDGDYGSYILTDIANRALVETMQMVFDLLDDCESKKDYNLHLRASMAERQRLVEAWSGFSWSDRKVNPVDHAENYPCKGKSCKWTGCSVAARARVRQLAKADCQTAEAKSVFRYTSAHAWPGRVITRGEFVTTQAPYTDPVKQVEFPEPTKRQLEIVERDNNLPDPNELSTYRTKGGDMSYAFDPVQKQFHYLATNRPIQDEAEAKVVEHESLNSSLDVAWKEDGDEVVNGLFDYPWTHPHHLKENLIVVLSQEMKSKPKYVPGQSFCDFVAENDGYWDVMDNVHTARKSVRRFSGNMNLWAIAATYKQVSPEYDVTERVLVHKDQENGKGPLGFWTKSGDWVQPKPHLKPIEQYLKYVLAGNIHLFPSRIKATFHGARRIVSPKKVIQQGTQWFFVDQCYHCSDRINDIYEDTGETDGWGDLVRNAPQGWLTRFKKPKSENRPYGAYTLFALDNVDRRWTQHELVGSFNFHNQDVWHLRGHSNEWCCLLCGRTKATTQATMTFEDVFQSRVAVFGREQLCARNLCQEECCEELPPVSYGYVDRNYHWYERFLRWNERGFRNWKITVNIQGRDAVKGLVRHYR